MLDTIADPVMDATRALGELGALDVASLADDDVTFHLMRIQELRGALEAAEARILHEWDERKLWRADGAKTGSAWLAARMRLPIAVTRRRMRHARGVDAFPSIADAWAIGAIDRCHVTTILRCNTERTAALFAVEHPALLDAARTRSFVDFKRSCDTWLMVHDPDGAEDRAAEDLAARSVHLSRSWGGMWFGDMTFDPVNGTIVHETLRAIERELFEADWAAAKRRLGRDPLVSDLGRTPAQRRADAMVEMATRARTAPAGGRRPAPLFTVVVGLDMWTGPILELLNRTVITPGTAVAWLTEADVERVVFDSPSRVVDVGAQRRFFRGAIRKAIETRDRTCFHELCDEVPDRAQIDHIVEAAKGGLTTQRNGRLGCDFHNNWRNTHPDSDPDPPDDG